MSAPDNSLPSVFVIGDSISIQYGPYLEKGLEGAFQYSRKGNDGEISVSLDIPQGPNGGDSSRVLAYLRLRQERGDLKPDVLAVNCGLHDIKTEVATGQIQISLEDYRKNLQEIIRVVRELGAAPVWIQTTHIVDAIHNERRAMSFHRFAANHAAYTAVADEVMTAAGVPIADMCRFTRGLGADEEIFCDHAHFHENVRQRQGAFLAGWLIGWYAGSRGK